MIQQHENKVVANLMLYIDHQILSKGHAFTNYSSFFYPTNTTVNGLHNYSAPFKQMVGDASISGANIMSGVYLDGNFKSPGQDNFVSLNYNQGAVQFSSSVTGVNRISGNYSIKDFNIYLTNKNEEEILFEKKIHLRPKTHQTLTGLSPDSLTYPSIFLKSQSSRNMPASFGGFDFTSIEVRAMVLADSLFNLDAACSILRDLQQTSVYYIEDELSFNAYGAYTGTIFNYTGLNKDNGYFVIDKTYVSKNIGAGMNDLNPEIFVGFVDFETKEIRTPRK